MTVKPVHSPGFTAYCNIGCMNARQLNMEAVEPLSGFEVGGPPTYPQTKREGGG